MKSSNKLPPKVSVIIPVYKVENYLNECLNSIVAQTYKNLEIVLVDDGSPDSCGEICNQYANIYDNIIVIHQPNSGLSAARNAGVQIATGDYISFVDSDDFVSDDYVEYLVYLVQYYHSDISSANYIKYHDRKWLDSLPEAKPVEHCFSTERALEEMCYHSSLGVTAWAKLYPKAYLLKHPYPCNQIYEELATTYKILAEATNISFSTKGIYFYRQRPESIVHQVVNERQLVGLSSAKEEIDFIHKYYPEIVDAAEYRFCVKACQLFDMACNTKEDKKWFIYFKKEITPYWSGVLKNPRGTHLIKIKCLALRTNRFFAKEVFKLAAVSRGLRKRNK